MASLLALLVLLSSSSFTVNMHLCGGHVQSVSVIEKAAPCAMEVKTPPCHKVKAPKKNSCCKDESLSFEGQHFKVQESVSLAAAHAAWTIELPLITTLSFASLHVSTDHYTSYKPPLIDHDITVFIQSFLI